MLSKEEIDRRLEQTGDDEATINLLYLKIDLLESDKQKLIEKLEETIDFTKTSKDLISKAKIEVLENVLKILKGETDEY